MSVQCAAGGRHGTAVHPPAPAAGPPLLLLALPACRVAPGILEKYEHLDKLRTHEGGAQAGGGGAAPAAPAGAAATGKPGTAAGEGQPCDFVNLEVYYTEPVALHLSPEYTVRVSADVHAVPAGGEGGGGAASSTLKTDAPGAGDTQHPGEWPPAGELQAEAEAQAESEDLGMAKE